jgi:predicted ribosomally synthesized peptide with SipW-like signal peptide
MKKIALSMSMIAVVGALVAGATGAFFSDTETSTGNTFTAGSIDLKVDSVSTYNGQQVPSATWALKDLVPTSDKFFNFNDVKPGDIGTTTVSLHVINNDAWACVQVSNLASNDNGLTEPESQVDGTDGAGNGELDNTMMWTVWRDDGDNVFEPGETVLASGNPTNGSLALHDSTTVGGPLLPASTTYVGVSWTLPASSGNETQTDSLTGDIGFYVVQSRNNADFKCSDIGQIVSEPEIVRVANLAQTASSTAWLFYNDTNDTVMTINQFATTGGTNTIVAGPGAVGAAQMILDNGTQSPDYDGSGDLGNPRYNIATYRYSDVKLADIGSLKYRIYDASVSSQTPYLHFNVDFNNSNTWQGRLVKVPTGVVVNTWTTVDALASTWTKTSGNWPAGVTSNGSIPGSTARTWAAILADYPNAETRSTDSFLGIRVGHPGPIGEESLVDWVEFDGQISDFEI